MSRRDELAEALGAVETRIAAACVDAGRARDDVELIVVTKFFPASDVDLLVDLGVRTIGESRDQEAAAKLEQVSARDELAVHFIGQLQRNKARSVAAYADVVQSVDRAKLVGALDRAATEAGRRLGVLLQADLDQAPTEDGRGGVPVEGLAALAEAVAETESLDLLGLMAVAPPRGDPDAAFARLQEAGHGIRDRWPQATWLSAGMSGDLEVAIARGATHLRVGSAILGSRPPLR